MKEIGGYFEFEHFEGQEYYPDLFKFNLGRCAIASFLHQMDCKAVFVPHFLCDSVTDALRDADIIIRRYHIKENFLPDFTEIPRAPLPGDVWLLVVNFYGQLADSQIRQIADKYQNVLFDYTHSFFQRPIPGINAVLSVRKFLGVSDGAYLQTDQPVVMPFEEDSSRDRLTHIMGRFEKDAGTFYQTMLDTAHGYVGASAKRMSPLTENFLKSFEYTRIADTRLRNYLRLMSRLQKSNPLRHILRTPDIGPFCYPYYAENGIEIRKRLAKKKIFVPTYWSNVIRDMPKDTREYKYAANILALPCDQRYGTEDMDTVADAVLEAVTPKGSLT